MKNELAPFIEHAVNGMDNISEGTYSNDLHHHLFNMDYFIIGYYKAEQFLINNGGIFNAIKLIREYEQDNFGTVSTDFSSSEKVCNMFAYIKGEEVLNNCKYLQKIYGKRLNQKDIDRIKSELEAML